MPREPVLAACWSAADRIEPIRPARLWSRKDTRSPARAVGVALRRSTGARGGGYAPVMSKTAKMRAIALASGEPFAGDVGAVESPIGYNG